MARYCYNPQTKFAKVMFSQVFVCPQGEVSVQGCLCPGDHCPWGSLSKGDSLSSGEEVPVQGGGGLCPGRSLSGLCPGWSLSGGSVSGRPPYGNEWAVHILLECILVYHCVNVTG